MKRSDLMRRMHRAGLRLDDAATAARIAEHALLSERNRLIESAVEMGLSVRNVGRIFGISKTHVSRVSIRLRGHGTDTASTIKP